MFTECLDTVRAQKRLLAMGFPQNTKFSGQYKCQAHSSVLAPLRQFCNLGLYCTLMSMEELGVPTTTSLIRQNRELLTQTAMRCFHYQTIFQINTVFPGNTARQREMGAMKIAHWTVLFWKRKKTLWRIPLPVQQHFHIPMENQVWESFPVLPFSSTFTASSKEPMKLYPSLSKEPKSYSQRHGFTEKRSTVTFIGSDAWVKITHICGPFSESVRRGNKKVKKNPHLASTKPGT